MPLAPKKALLSPLAKKVQLPRPDFQPARSPAEVVRDGKERANAILGRIRNVGRLPANPVALGFWEALAAGGEEGQELAAQIATRAKEELSRRRCLCGPLSELLTSMRSADSRARFRKDVLVPARTRSASSQDLSDAIDSCFPVAGKVLKFAEEKLGPLTIGIGIGVEGGAGLGFEAGFGIAGLRHHCVCVFDTATVALGTYAEAQGSFSIGVSQGIPEAYWSWGLAIDCSLSASYGVAAEATMSLVPVGIHRPSWDRPHIVDYQCVGLGLCLGVGAPGGGVALGITRTRSYTLPGKAS